MKVGELCQRLNVPYRHVRYILEEHIVPAGIAEKPGRGEHRDLSAAQAYWLGIVLLLKRSGIKTPLAGQIATFVQEGVRGIGVNLHWDRGFNPFAGQFGTEHQWFVDIADLTFVRIVTTACPSQPGLCELPWREIGRPKEAPHAAPFVIIRLDLTRLAQRLG